MPKVHKSGQTFLMWHREEFRCLVVEIVHFDREAGVTQENVIVCLDSRKIFLLFQLQFFRSWNYFALEKKESK